MQRGVRTFQNLLWAEPASSESADKRPNGRDPELVARRNRLIVHRYYYYARMVRKNYPDTLLCLQDEFFLSDIQLTRIVGEHGPLLNQLKHEAPVARYFEKLWPHLVW